MKKNNLLNRGDEFYTIPESLENELSYYDKSFFHNKIVCCPCNDGEHRGCVDVLKKHFKEYGMKLLFYTTYGNEGENGKLYIFNGVKEMCIELPHKGDFREGKCLEAFEMSDIIITGPPYSLFTDFFIQLIKYKKDFIISTDYRKIGTVKIFPYFKEGKIWRGATKPKKYSINSEYTEFTTLGNNIWLTNIKHKGVIAPMDLTFEYNKEIYKNYTNFNAIEVSKVSMIPKDYDGVMGVPINFIDKYCPQQFEILAMCDNTDLAKPYRIPNRREGYSNGMAEGESKMKNQRILIKRINKKTHFLFGQSKIFSYLCKRINFFNFIWISLKNLKI